MKGNEPQVKNVGLCLVGWFGKAVFGVTLFGVTLFHELEQKSLHFEVLDCSNSQLKVVMSLKSSLMSLSNLTRQIAGDKLAKLIFGSYFNAIISKICQFLVAGIAELRNTPLLYVSSPIPLFAYNRNHRFTPFCLDNCLFF